MNSKYIILAAAALFLLPGCQKEAPGDGTGLPMRVAPTLAGDTKGSLTTADLTDIYLQVSAADPAYSYFEHASKDGSGAWTTPSTLYWKDEATPVSYAAARFGAHAFTAADFKNGVGLELPTDQSTQERLNAADLLTMPAASKKFTDTADGTLPVALSHGLAKLTITLTLGPKFYDNFFGIDSNPVEGFTVSGSDIGFNFQPQTGAVSATPDTKADISPLAGTFTPATAESKSATATYEAILVPQTLAAGALKVTFKVEDYDYEWSNATALTLKSGETYNLAVSVTAAPPQNISYVRMEDGLRWAAWNVGATAPDQRGEYYAWAEVAPKDSYGQGTYLWQQPGIDLWYNITKYTFPDGETDSNWYSGDVFIGDGKTMFADYDYADDAARQNWGRSWRTPTPAEWQWLIDNCTWEWQTDYLGTGVTGMLVTSHAAGYAGNSIFLPAAGYLRNESYYYYGSEGSYWSSSLSEDDVTYAKHLDFEQTSDPSLKTSMRYRGFTVRPVCN